MKLDEKAARRVAEQIVFMSVRDDDESYVRDRWKPEIDAGTALILAYEAAKPASGSGEQAGWIVTNAEGDKFRTWDQVPVWTSDREIATRYARREDAERAHAEDEDAWCIVECTTPPAPATVERRAGEALADAVESYLKHRYHSDLDDALDAYRAALAAPATDATHQSKCGFPFCSCAKRGVCAHALAVPAADLSEER
jgi:hypothetical protein